MTPKNDELMPEEKMSKVMPDIVWLQYNYGWKTVEQVVDGRGFKYIRADIAAQGEDEGWRTDIENAPKDGSTIIIPGGIAYYRENKTYPHYSGWHSITGIEMPGRPLQYELKQWMPFPVLPAPPVIGENK